MEQDFRRVAGIINDEIEAEMKKVGDADFSWSPVSKSLDELFAKYKTTLDLKSVPMPTCAALVESLSNLIKVSTKQTTEIVVCESEEQWRLVASIFNVLIILTRDQRVQSTILNEHLKYLLFYSGINPSSAESESVLITQQQQADQNEQVGTLEKEIDLKNKAALAALKCLCNIVYQSQNNPVTAGGDPNAISRLKDADFENKFSTYLITQITNCPPEQFQTEVGKVQQYLSPDLIHFQFNLFFIYSAIVVDSRKYFLRFPKMYQSLCRVMECLIKSSENFDAESWNYEMMPNGILSNVLKTIYALISNIDVANSSSEEEKEFFNSLAKHCKRIVLLTHADISNPKSPSSGDLSTNTYSIIGVLPSCSLQKYFMMENYGKTTVGEVNKTEEKNFEMLYCTLYKTLKIMLSTEESQSLNISFKMALLLGVDNLVRSCRSVRKYMRFKILPPRKDVHVMPNKGQELKNDLVRMMTGVNRELAELVSDFLFVLCKENVNRLVKYTGYGNAAGMMFTRGLGFSNKPQAEYSDDEDSETEEFKQHLHGFNYVTGRFEGPKPDPFEGMSEEQKMYETEKLLNTLSRVQNTLFQPMTMDSDGKPVALFDKIAKEAAEREDSAEEDSD